MVVSSSAWDCRQSYRRRYSGAEKLRRVGIGRDADEVAESAITLGICGKLPSAPASVKALRPLRDAQKTRGPD